MKSTFLNAAIGLVALVAQPLAARPAELALIPSPWGGSMSRAEQEASAAMRPAFADANWNHEVCVIAYSFEGVPEEIARRRKALQRGYKDGPAEAETRRQLAELERQANEHLPNIAKCTGQFFRPAVKSLCAYQAGENRFCAQLSGEALPGVELVDDEELFARGLAWNKVGNLFSKGIAFAPAPWAAADARSVDLARTDLSGIPYIAATNKAAKAEGGSPAGQSVGQWAFSIEMQRLKMADGDDSLTNLSAEFAAKTGMATSIAEFDQFPQLHFQAYMFDILVADDAAILGLEMRDGTRRRLEDIASFRTVPESSPAFYTSFASYRIHAVALLSPDEMRMILDPTAAFLTASFAMRLEDGRIDTVTLRTPLTGVADAWKAMNAANLDADWRIRRVLTADQGGVQ